MTQRIEHEDVFLNLKKITHTYSTAGNNGTAVLRIFFTNGKDFNLIFQDPSDVMRFMTLKGLFLEF